MSAGCSYCGAQVKAQTEGGRTHSVNAWSSTRYECGTESHSDGVERSAECLRREAEKMADPVILVADAEPVPAPAGLLGDMTALALSANIRGMTVEGVHQSVTEICKRYGLEPRSSDREKVADFAKALAIGLIVIASKRPKITEDALDAMLDSLIDDIRNRLNITISEMQENA